MKIVRLTYYLA